MDCSFLKAEAVAVVVGLVAVLAATAAAASYVSAAPLPAGLLSSPPFRWIAVHVIVIVIWLVSSYRHHNTAASSSSSASNADDVSSAMHGLYPSSEDGVFAAPVAPDVLVVAPVSKRQAGEARTAKRADRPRVRKKSTGDEKPRAVAAEAKPDGKKPGEEEKSRALAAEAKPDDIDVSMDSMWQAIVQRGAARPVAVQKSETWSSDELPGLERAAEKAVARREMRKSATMVPASPPHPAAAPAAFKRGWRTRDELVMAHDELLRRAESLIRRHHEHLRLQRQESDQRQAMEHQRRRSPALIRV